MATLYLFTGPELGEKDDAVESLKKKNKEAQGKLDIHTLYAYETSMHDVIFLLQSGNLFSDATFVVLRNAELIKKKEDFELLENWLKSKTQGTLVLISNETSVEKKLESLIPKENKRVFWEMFENRKQQWVRNFFSQQGYQLEDGAIESILELIENNTQALKVECSRFFICFEKTHIITATDVEQMLFHSREENAFSLFDVLTIKNNSPQQRFEHALSVLQKIRLSKESSSVQLLAGFTFCFRKLYQWHLLNQNNFPSDFDLKIKGFSSKKAQERYKSAQTLWNLATTNQILAMICKTDFEIRSLGTTFEDVLLQILLYKIILVL